MTTVQEIRKAEAEEGQLWLSVIRKSVDSGESFCLPDICEGLGFRSKSQKIRFYSRIRRLIDPLVDSGLLTTEIRFPDSSEHPTRRWRRRYYQKL